MGRYLLTGAGFSRKWGAPLAAGLWAFIYNNLSIQNNSDCRDVLLSEDNFETAYSNILKTKNEFAQAAISEALKDAFKYIDDEIRQNRDAVGGTQNFLEIFLYQTLGKKAGIITLNQDLLLERHFLFSSQQQIKSNILPLHHLYVDGIDWGEVPPKIKIPVNTENLKFDLELNAINYIKLHGSSNWVDSNDSDLMIIGNEKNSQINEFNVLNKMLKLVRSLLKEGKNKLLIIGYSFCDDHINDILSDAICNAELKLYIISPSPYHDLQSRVQDFSGKLAADRISKAVCGYYDVTFEEFISSTALMSQFRAGFID